MPTRNLILWIIVLVILSVVAFGFFYFQTPRPSGPTGGGTNFVATLWPFGKSDNIETPSGDGVVDISGYEIPPEGQIQTSRLKKISSMPVAGYGVFLKERYGETEVELVPYVRYINKANAHVYQTFIDDIDERTFSSTTIPRLHEAFLGNNGSNVILRYLGSDERTIQTYAGVLPEEVLGGDTTINNEFTGTYLPENISEVTLSPDSMRMFYLLPIGDGVVGISAKTNGQEKSQVFDSPFTEWLLDWPNDRMITFTTKPSANVPGYMYALDPINKDLSKLLGGINGLTTLTSPSGKLVLYSDNNLNSMVTNRDTKAVVRIGVQTLPEKCVWGEFSEVLYCAVPNGVSGGGYPDNWYRGEISFSDRIWKIDAINGNGTLLSDPLLEINGEEIDATNPMLDPTEKYLFFMNKNDSYLWMLEL